jgi:hypothetical protein
MLFGIHEGHRGQLRQNKSNSPNATTADKKRGVETSRPYSSTE